MDLQCTGVRESYYEKLRKRTPCPECGVELTAGSTMENMRRIQGTEPDIGWKFLLVNQTEHLQNVYNVSFPKVMTQNP